MKKLCRNVGSYDAAARFSVGCGLLSLANHGYVWGYAGFVLAATAGGLCPVYWLFGLNTTSTDRPKPSVDRPAFARTPAESQRRLAPAVVGLRIRR